MAERTVGEAAPIVNGNLDLPKLIAEVVTSVMQALNAQNSLRGIPRDMYCKANEVRAHMNWDRETWRTWCEAGLETDYPGTQAEHVDTNKLIDFLNSRPDLSAAKLALNNRKTTKRSTPKKTSTKRKEN